MPKLWTLRCVSALLVLALGVAFGGACSAVSTGVDACRQIESARCNALSTCDKANFIGTADSCTRFYDVQCGRGLADGAREPSAPELKACTDRIVADCTVAHDPLASVECKKFLSPEPLPDTGTADTGTPDTTVADTTPEAD